MSAFLEELNEVQHEAVTYIDGPSLVIAGAGSGKTRVLTYKIAYLLQQDLPAYSILALTFTNKAANEMKERIGRLVGEEKARQLWMGTFHSIFARILRIESQAISFSSNYTIYDTTDSKSLIKSIIREKGLDEKIYVPNKVLNQISKAKNRLIGPDAYLRNVKIAQADAFNHMPEIGNIYASYMARCRQADAMDFDDILLYTFQLFSLFPDIRQKYAERFQYILVDEYQDTNYAQHAIIWQLSEHDQHVCVVGDDAQSIYSFRGANIDNILTFQQIYKNVKLFKLEQNYRSTQNIVNAANSLISHNQRQITKNIFSKKQVGTPVNVVEYYSDLEEAAGVSKKIEQLVRDERHQYQDITILYRTNAQSRSFEETFRKKNIPYRIYGGLSFYDRKEIKDIIAYFRLSVNPHDEEAIKRIINYPTRGLGNTTLNKIYAAAVQYQKSIWQIITNLTEFQIDISKNTQQRISDFVNIINNFHAEIANLDAHELGVKIIKESGVAFDIYKSHEPEDISKQENIEELVDGLAQFVENEQENGGGRVLLTHFLQEVSLLSDIDESEHETDDKVSLMTIHSAKGLEFKSVFIVGVEENLFPNQNALSTEREIEEERRLFYVAITRSIEHCFISYALNRYLYGKPNFCTPSRFISEIDKRFLDCKTLKHSHFDDKHVKQKQQNTHTFIRDIKTLTPISNKHIDTTQTPQPAPNMSLKVNDIILHQRFGRGKVLNISGSGPDTRAIVEFDNVGTKTLLLRFSKFEKL